MKINFQKSLLLFSIIFFILSCVIFYFLYEKIKENHAEAEKLSVEAQEEANHLEELRLLGRGVKTIEKERIELDKHFVPYTDLVPFLDTIEALGPRVGASTEILTVELSGDGANLLVGLEARGGFGALYKFVTLLENSDYEIEITSFDLSKDPQKDWRIRVGVKLISFIK